MLSLAGGVDPQATGDASMTCGVLASDFWGTLAGNNCFPEMTPH